MAASLNGGQNGLYTYDQFSGKKKNRDTHFLWWCAGAHQELLKEFPSEHTRYAGLGGVVLATFVLASISAGYAIYSVFDNPGWAVVFAITWGLIIFNFDRFLISTMRKYGVSPGKQLWMVLPRIVLALLISITIARPLELKIFEKEIDVKVAANRHRKILLNDSLLQLENNRVLSAADGERARLLARKGSIEDTLRRLQQAYVDEADGTGGSRQRGIEKLTRLKQDAYQAAGLQFGPELLQLGKQIGYQDSILNNVKANTETKRKQYESLLTEKVGFLERNKALSDLTSEEGSVFWATLFISLLIILIETGPILSKLIMHAGPYDVALARTELLQMAQSENDMRKDKQLLFDRLEGLYKRKKEMSDQMLDKLKALQQKHIDE
ncbi:MAG TPA: DUF4407 domain-containing protein, partial [Puia sp.]|nr:DUF4407 domain-containing protein [Puia sp.]